MPTFLHHPARRAASAFFLTLLIAGSASVQGPEAEGAAPRRRLEQLRQWDHDWSRGAVFYQVFVRSFADSDGDGIGDLPGLIGRLDYLNDGDPSTTADLGIDALWLMPVFASPSYHGYDVSDYESINPDYGTVDDFERLCTEAHRRGIRVILDLVINHTGTSHAWFVDSAGSPSAPHRDWYVWNPTNPGWTQPWGGNSSTWHPNPVDGYYYYGLFWSGMPDLNLRNGDVRAEVKRLAKRWLDRGADGFRLDAARYLIEDGPGRAQQDTAGTHAFWREFAAFVRGYRPDAVLVGENWAEAAVIATYYGSATPVVGGDELPMNFDFPLAASILAGVNAGNATGIAASLAEVEARYPAGANDAPFLTNHDQVRAATQLGTVAGRLRSAAALLLTLPGAPFIYYGEEVGVQNGSTTGDESKRTPMPWDATPGGGFTTGVPWFPFAPGRAAANVATETSDPSSLLSRYRSLIRLRQGSVALQRGELQVLTRTTWSAPVLAFVATADGERVLVVHNLTDGFAQDGPYPVEATGFDTLFADQGAQPPSGASGALRITLPPRATAVWRLR